MDGTAPALPGADTLIPFAEQLIRIAAEEGVTLRLIGSLGVRRRCGVIPGLQREAFRDIDLVGLGRQSAAIRALLESRGYAIDPSLVVSQEYGVRRLIFTGPDLPKVDVFLDDLEMSHTVPLAERLDLDAPTVSPVDLLLSKLQVHDLTVKDVQDVVALLATHPLGTDAPGAIDLRHLVGLLRADWGFCQTTTTNLGHVRAHVDSAMNLPEPIRAEVLVRLGGLRTAIGEAPKTMRWKARARVGTRVRWWEEVSDAER
jgi:hypothetical protein